MARSSTFNKKPSTPTIPVNSLGFYSGLVVFLGVVFGGILAFHDSFLTVGQMLRRGINRGIPYILHMGMWGDATIITYLIARIMSLYGTWWTMNQWLVFGGISACVSAIMHWTYTQSTIAESHVIRGRLRPTGWWHMIYMTGALTPFLLLYFSPPPHMDQSFIVSTSILLQVHIFLGTHIPLGLWNPKCYGRRPDMTAWVTNTLVAILLGWRTCDILAVL